MNTELRRWVHENVMGKKWEECPHTKPLVFCACPEYPYYDTNEKDAFKVVAKMRERGFEDFTLNQFSDHGGKWQAIFTRAGIPLYGDEDFVSPDCDTPALAICLAARSAIEGGKV
jgi:hypothetical protein